MRWGSLPIGIVVLFLTIGLLLFLQIMPFLRPEIVVAPPLELTPESTRAEVGAFIQAQFGALPPWVKIWMYFQKLIFAAGLCFVLWKREAQIYLAGFVASHVFFILWMRAGPVEMVSLNLTAFSHWIWIPALVAFVRAWPKIENDPGYKTFVTVAIAQLVFSLSFDVPQGVGFLRGLVF